MQPGPAVTGHADQELHNRHYARECQPAGGLSRWARVAAGGSFLALTSSFQQVKAPGGEVRCVS